MYISVRKYKVSSPEKLTEEVKKGFIPLVSKAPGFVSYHTLTAHDGTWASISIFDSQGHAEESNKLASNWIKEHPHVAQLIHGSPEITAGPVGCSETK